MKREFLVGIVICLVVGVLFFGQYILNINKPLGLTHGDAFLVNFILKHYFQTIATGDWNNLSTLPMFYGFKNSLFFSDHHFIHAVLASPLFLVTKDIIITSNLLIISTLLMSLTAMYTLCYFFTKHVLASVLGAIIFVLNPFILARFPDQLILLSLQWIPLIFLFFEMSLKKTSPRNTFLFFFFLTCQLLSSLYYSVFLTVILPIYCLVRLKQNKESLKPFLNKGTVVGGMLFLVVAIISGALYFQVFSKEPVNRGLDMVDVYSAWPSDYLFAPPSNVLYGGLKETAITAVPNLVRRGIYSEQNLLMGVTALSLFIASFFLLKNSTHKKNWRLWLGLFFLSILLSFGPRIHLTYNLYLPSPYALLYFADPLFSFIRAASRFGVFVFFFLSLIISMTLSEVYKRINLSKALVVSLILIFLTVFEYWNKPLGFLQITEEVRRFYSILDQQKQIKVVLHMPIGNDIPLDFVEARPEDRDAHYLLWATVLHNKQLFNGYTGFFPAQYYSTSRLLSTKFPNLETLHLLRKLGVDGVILDKSEFNIPQQYEKMRNLLIIFNVPVVTSTPSLTLFDLTNWKTSRSQRIK